MMFPSNRVRIMVATKPIDFRKGHDGLEVNLLRFPAPEDFRPKGLIVRQLRQRWGSMSPASRLLLNRRLTGR